MTRKELHAVACALSHAIDFISDDETAQARNLRDELEHALQSVKVGAE